MFGNHDFHYAGNMPLKPGRDPAPPRLSGRRWSASRNTIKDWDWRSFEHIRYCDLCDADQPDVLSNHYFKYLVDNGLGDAYEDSSGSLPGVDIDYGQANLPYRHSHEAWTGNESVKFLENRDVGRPFFLFTSFERPHPTWRVAEEIFNDYAADEIQLPASAVDAFENDFAGKPDHIRLAMQKRRKTEEMTRKCIACYYALITAIDGEIGRILECLRQRGELDNTIIIYTSDHGDLAGEHGLIRKNIGIYEPVHRIPFLIHAPGIKPAVDGETMVESIDLYPTVCELCGLEVPDSVEGRSFVAALKDGRGGRERALCEWAPSHNERIHAIRTRDWRLVHYCRQRTGELYHCAEDPGELRNLWDSPEHSAKKAELLEYLLAEVSLYKINSHQQSSKARDFRMFGSGPMNQIAWKGKKWSQIKKQHY